MITDRDGFWWLVAVVLGVLVSVGLPKLLAALGYAGSFSLIFGPFAAGALVGCLRPDRPWRWGVAVFLANSLSALPVSLAGGPAVFALLMTFGVVLALPSALLGAYLGALARRGSSVVAWRVPLRPTLGILLASAAAAVPGWAWVAQYDEGLFAGLRPYAPGLLIVIAVGFGVIDLDRRWRTGLVIAVGFLLAAVLKVLIDQYFRPGSHNLAPFEIFITMVFGVPLSFAGVYAGLLMRMLLRRIFVARTRHWRA